MSQMVTRNRTGGDEKEKRTDSPVKDMKKKMAANAEKEKNAAETAPSKSDKPAEKPADKPADKATDKPADKPADKSKADKPADKQKEKAPEKPAEKSKAADKPAEKSKAADKPAEKSKAAEKPAEKSKAAEKPAEKKDGPSEKKKEENGKGEISGKSASTACYDSKQLPQRGEFHPYVVLTDVVVFGSNQTEKPGKPKQNGSSNGMNGTTHASDSELLADEGDETELFPELAYDDSDVEWEPGQESRSLTRRSQVKATRTPETPRPASGKAEGDESKESKVLKLSQEPAKDAPKSDKKSDAKSDKKSDAKKDAKQDGVQDTPKADAKKDVKESPKKDDKSEKVEIQVVVEIENSSDPTSESRKPDTNFSKSRVKVSPYRRSTRLADQTTSSMAANYTGNNTTMEMDITETSSFMDETLDDSYLSGLRSIKGRRSYKPLTEMALRHTTANRSVRSVTSTIVSEQSSRPTAPVVGRKRKPELDDVSFASEADEADEAPVAGKRQRLLERLARPFRRTTLLPARRNAEIVGINTDLPLTAPVASTSGFDPETLKPRADPALPPALLTPTAEESKRCAIM